MPALARIITEPLEKAGIVANGDQPFDIQIHNPQRLSRRIAFEGTLGFGEAYMDGDWDCDDIPGLVSRLFRSGVDNGHTGLTGTLLSLAQKFRNEQNMRRSLRVAEQHYDLGNEFYAHWLGERMVYTCGYWKNAQTLDEAQEAKLDLVCKKIGLKHGQKVLDVGCGFGSFARFAAERYGAEVVGITISEEQLALGQKLCAGLPVELRFMDYRDLHKEYPWKYFDHIVSLGMFEHVGPRNYHEYMQVLAPLLKPEGLFLLHTIGGVQGGFEPWIERYIFPGGYIPTLQQIADAAQDHFIIEDLHNFGADYDRTLCAWDANFVATWPEIKRLDPRFDERFYRMWRYYLCAVAGSFRARNMQLWQFVLSPKGVEGGYQSIR